MGYSIKKAGIAFKAKVDTSSDFVGQELGFKAFVINDATGVKTDVIGNFTEDANTPGLYFSPDITITTPGDYTLVTNNVTAGMDNHPTPLVVTVASIDDIKNAVDGLDTKVNNVYSEVQGLNGEDLTALKTTIEQIKLLINDQDATTVNSVMEFVAQIDAALAGSGSGLAALSGFTDDIENMLVGTEFLSDGTTNNPFYDPLKPGVAKESTLYDGLQAVQTAITNISDNLAPSFEAVNIAIEGVRTVVDANKVLLEDPNNGLSALKAMLDTLSTGQSTSTQNILDILNDPVLGLSNIRTEMNTRFDAVDTSLATIDGKLDSLGSAQGFRAFV